MKLFSSLTAISLIVICFSACSPNNVTERDDWATYFKANKVKGCFMLYNNGSGDFDIYNLKRTQKRFLPASTFKIMNSLVGLESGIISDTSMVIKWDSIPRSVEAWNHDLTMAQAFRVSAVPYYQEVARRIGRDTMRYYIDSVKYGNMNIAGRIDSFWLDDSLKISPDEQLGFVENLYFGQLPFQDRSQRLVRDVMLMERNNEYSLSYKTGWGREGNKQIGWLVGWEEENKHPYFFVLNIESDDPGIKMPEVRMKIFRAIMEKEGFFKGNK